MNTADIDLIALLPLLEKWPQYNELATRIKRVVTVGSAKQDLDHAADALNCLSRLQKETPLSLEEKDLSNMVGALFSHAIILYARATETKPIDRQFWFGRSMLTEGERAWHEQAIRYRDRVLAHFGKGGHLKEGPTIRDHLVIQLPLDQPSEIRVTYVESRAQARASLSAKLALLVRRVAEIAEKSWHNRLAELGPLLVDMIRTDPAFVELAKQSFFDPAPLHALGWDDPFAIADGGPKYASFRALPVIDGDDP